MAFLGTIVAKYDSTGARYAAVNGRFEFLGTSRIYLGTSTSARLTYTTAVDIAQFFTNCTATTGICTGLDFEHAIGYQGSTALQGTGIRGVLRVLTGTTHTAGYNEGAAGYLLMAGTIDGTGTYYGVRGAVLDGGTWTACTAVYAVCAEYKNNSTVTSGATGCIRALNLSNKTIDDVMFIYNHTAITYALHFEELNVAPISADATAFSGLTASYKIACKAGDQVFYLHGTTA